MHVWMWNVRYNNLSTPFDAVETMHRVNKQEVGRSVAERNGKVLGGHYCVLWFERKRKICMVKAESISPMQMGSVAVKNGPAIAHFDDYLCGIDINKV